MSMTGNIDVASSRVEPQRGALPRAGIDAEMERFVNLHYDRMVGLAVLVCNHHANAQDAVQSALERAWRSRATIRDPERLQSWIDKIVVRESIRVTSSWRSRIGRLLSSAPMTDVEASATGGRSANDEWIDARRAFAALPAEQRAVLALHLHAGYSISETAEIVGAPVETVRTRLRRGRARMRDARGESS